MGIASTDAIIKTAIDLSLEDMRANDWLLDDIFSDLVTNSYLNKRYGKKQVNAAKEWFKNNKISVSLGYVSDRMEMPHVTIVLGSQNEKPEMKTNADLSPESIKLLPTQINKPIPFIMKPFSPTSYDRSNGIVYFNQNLPGADNLAVGMILVNPATGEGWIIQDVGANCIYAEPNTLINAALLAVVPANQFYIARVEHSFSQASFQVICTAHGDPQSAIWLHDIVLYGLYRYREALLEANNIAETVFQSSDLRPSPMSADGGDLIWQRVITISTQIEQTWIKTPQRVVEPVNLRQSLPNSSSQPYYIGGVSILSNLDAQSFVDVWYTDTPQTADADFQND